MESTPDNPILLFHVLHRAHRNAVDALLSRQGLQDVGSPMILMLLQSCENGQITAQKNLADRLHVSPATIATSLKSLERMGYISKQPDQTDTRRKRVQLTPKGACAVGTCRQIFQEIDRTLYSGFTQEELTQLEGFHRRMLQNLLQVAGANSERKEG